MCHNTNMKKAVLLVLPCVLLLSSCQEITFAFSRNDTHPAGLDNEGGSSKNEDVGPYSYYKGDSIVFDSFYGTDDLSFSQIMCNQLLKIALIEGLSKVIGHYGNVTMSQLGFGTLVR